MARCRCGAIEVAGCVCSFTDTSCIEITGSGTAANPFVATATVDPDPDNLLVCGVDGLGAFLPPELQNVPAVRVHRNLVQTITHNTSTPIEFTAERFDTDSMHDNSTNPSRLTVVTPGIYQVTSLIQFAWAAAGDRASSIVLNGATVIGGSTLEPPGDSGHTTRIVVTTLWEFIAGDYIEVNVFQDSGGDLDVLRSPAFSPEFMAVRVASG